jgi:hypothetical protein
VFRRESGEKSLGALSRRIRFQAGREHRHGFGINGFLPIHTAGNRGEQALASLADVIKMHHGVSHLDVGSFGGGTPLIALGIEDAEIMARDGITKKQVKDYLWEHASLKFSEIPARRKGHKSDDELMRESIQYDAGRRGASVDQTGRHHGHRCRRQASPLGVSADVDRRNTLCAIKGIK